MKRIINFWQSIRLKLCLDKFCLLRYHSCFFDLRFIVLESALLALQTLAGSRKTLFAVLDFQRCSIQTTVASAPYIGLKALILQASSRLAAVTHTLYSPPQNLLASSGPICNRSMIGGTSVHFVLSDSAATPYVVC